MTAGISRGRAEEFIPGPKPPPSLRPPASESVLASCPQPRHRARLHRGWTEISVAGNGQGKGLSAPGCQSEALLACCAVRRDPRHRACLSSWPGRGGPRRGLLEPSSVAHRLVSSTQGRVAETCNDRHATHGGKWGWLIRWILGHRDRGETSRVPPRPRSEHAASRTPGAGDGRASCSPGWSKDSSLDPRVPGYTP